VLGLALLMGLFFAVRALEKLAEPRSGALALALRFLRFAQVPSVILIAAPRLFALAGV
jgi:hypothetical protein